MIMKLLCSNEIMLRQMMYQHTISLSLKNFIKKTVMHIGHYVSIDLCSLRSHVNNYYSPSTNHVDIDTTPKQPNK